MSKIFWTQFAAKLFYKLLRPYFVKMIDNPNSDIDEQIVKIIDLTIGYKAK